MTRAGREEDEEASGRRRATAATREVGASQSPWEFPRRVARGSGSGAVEPGSSTWNRGRVWRRGRSPSRIREPPLETDAACLAHLACMLVACLLSKHVVCPPPVFFVHSCAKCCVGCEGREHKPNCVHSGDSPCHRTGIDEEDRRGSSQVCPLGCRSCMHAGTSSFGTLLWGRG